MTGRTIKSASLAIRPSRPTTSRTSSSSSMRSFRSQGCESSPAYSPSASELTSYFANTGTASSTIEIGRANCSSTQDFPPREISRTSISTTSTISHQTAAATSSPQNGQSRPITITLPPARKKSLATDTPPAVAPLSARGDYIGGYFPFHEDVSRSYKPHPFHHYEELSPWSASTATPTTTTIATAAEELGEPRISSRSASRTTEQNLDRQRENIPPHTNAQAQTQSRERPSEGKTVQRERPSLTALSGPPSFFPTMSVAEGKYHPSKFDVVVPTSVSQRSHPSLRHNLNPNTNHGLNHNHNHPSPASHVSGTHKPGYSEADAKNDAKNEVRRKLKQYQRDMVEAAALAASLAIPERGPASPRLGPLGSPGPVTPMELEGEGEGDGWLGARDRLGTKDREVNLEWREMVEGIVRATGRGDAST